MSEDSKGLVDPGENEEEGWDELFPHTDWDDMSPDDPPRRIDPVPVNQFLYLGQALTGHEFSLYVERYNFGVNPPNFVVVHHTAIPYTMAAPAPGKNLNKAWDANEGGMSAEQIKQKRLRQLNNAKEYYRKTLLWDRGPHLFIDDRYIYLFTPMYDVGIHAKQGNSYTAGGKLNYSIGIEVIGHYTNRRWPEPVAQLVGHAIAMLKKQLNTFELVYKPWAGGISGHRDYNKPACPGNAVTNDFIIQAAKAGWQRLHQQVTPQQPRPAPQQPKPAPQRPTPAPSSSGGLSVNSPLLAPASGSKEKVTAYLRRHLGSNSEYKSYDIDIILGYYWKFGAQVGVDPYLAVIQSIYETDGWRSWWAGRPRRNPANLGVTSPTVGLSFKTWELSAQAHIGQLLAFALKDNQLNSAQGNMVRKNPNHNNITASARGRARVLGDLSGRWKNDSNYANSVVAKAREVERG